MREPLEWRNARSLARSAGVGTLGGRLEQSQPLTQAPAPAQQPSPGRGATVVVSTIWASDKEQRNADIVCDGVDDHVQIAAACDYCDSAGGGVVQLLGPYFVIGATVTVHQWVNLQGTGIEATYLEVADGITGFSLEQASRLSDVWLVGLGTTPCGEDAVNGSSGSAVTAGTFDDAQILRVRIEAFVNGIYRCGAGVIADCVIADCDNGIHGDASYGLARVRSNQLYDCVTAIFSADAGRPEILDNYILGCTDGIDVGCDESIVARNHIEGYDSGYGVRVRNTAPWSIVTGNHVRDALIGYSFEGQQCHGIGNSALGISQHGAQLSGNESQFCEGRIISAATTGTNLYDGINVTGDRCVVTNNMLDLSNNNPRAGVRVEAAADKTRVALNRVNIAGAGVILSDAGTNTRKNFDGSANDWNVGL